jgi:hypothetical protein
MGGGVIRRGNGVGTLADDAAVFDDHCAKRPTFAGNDILRGQCDGAPEKLWIW